MGCTCTYFINRILANELLLRLRLSSCSTRAQGGLAHGLAGALVSATRGARRRSSGTSSSQRSGGRPRQERGWALRGVLLTHVRENTFELYRPPARSSRCTARSAAAVWGQHSSGRGSPQHSRRCAPAGMCPRLPAGGSPQAASAPGARKSLVVLRRCFSCGRAPCSCSSSPRRPRRAAPTGPISPACGDDVCCADC